MKNLTTRPFRIMRRIGVMVAAAIVMAGCTSAAQELAHHVHREARMADTDTAKHQTAIAQETVVRQTVVLAIAGANTQRDQACIARYEMQQHEVNSKEAGRGQLIKLDDVLFNANKAQMEAAGMRKVQMLAGFLTKYPEYKVLVEGYTDSRGSTVLNQVLSDRRAYAVRTALIDMDISSDRVRTRGYGEKFPVADNDTAARRQLNRRVEVIVSDNYGNIAPR
ncbi:OmpA family protein [Methylomicrobium sp. Wu6]|uniref:OmpA family protein n=1 Tax=Methylomicrobium sp. Wu6 TaxID=3107928 RepID=UPI002DD669FF|nr:OmpA family protein [Methylomicrobium sp. Wu6]MEC4746863.1 OmpA family protein [Methylomicrobium sp. Wu6]